MGAATALVIGSIIGSGLFMKPASMAAELGSPVWLSLVWVMAGLFTLAGALIFAELGAMMPYTGGLFIYYKKIFGEFFAYLYGWSALAVINTAAIAAICFVCAEYADHFLRLPRWPPGVETSLAIRIPMIGNLYPLENFGVKALAIFILISLTWMNTRSTRAGSYFQVLSTVLKLLAIGGLVFGILFSGAGDTSNFVYAESPARGSELVSGVVIALTGAFFAFDGWTNLGYVAGELKEPQKNLARSLIAGVLVTLFVYLLVNQAYLYVLPVEQMATSDLVAADAIRVAWGNAGADLIAAMIVICTVGAANGSILATTRVSYAMSKEGLFPRWIGKESAQGKTPANALWLHAGWTTVLIFSGSFNMLADMFVFVSWIAYLFGALGMMLLRKRWRDADRPYRAPWYPVLPLLFILFSGFYLVITVISDVRNYINDVQPVINSLLGMGLVLTGVPLYVAFRRRWRR